MMQTPQKLSKRLNISFVTAEALDYWYKIPCGRRSRMVETFVLGLAYKKDPTASFINYYRIREIIRSELSKQHQSLLNDMRRIIREELKEWVAGTSMSAKTSS